MAQQFISGRFRSILDSGLRNVGGRLYTYASGTTTHKDAYTDATLGVPCTYAADGGGRLYIALDARGEAQVWLGAGAYTMVDATSLGVTLDTTDGVSSTDSQLATSIGSSLIGFLQSGVRAVLRTIQDKLRDRVDVADFMTAAEIADVRSYAGTLDVTAAVQAAINRGGIVLMGRGKFRITSTLTVSNSADLWGENGGQVAGPGAAAPATWLFWDGADGVDMIHFGGFGTLMIGGGIRDLMLDGAGKANPLVEKDHQRSYFRAMHIVGVKTQGILVTNSAGLLTMRNIYDNCYINLRDGASASGAHGIALDGVNTGASDGVTLCTVNRMAIDHVNGNAVLVRQIGDAWTWNELQTYRIDADSGAGVYFIAQRAVGAGICGYHLFKNPLVSAGFIFVDAGFHGGTRIINDGQGDINVGTQRLYGAGSGEVEYTGGYGFTMGRGMLPDPHRLTVRDPMAFMRYDAVNQILTTADRSWRVAVVGTSTVSDSAQSGSAVRLATSNSASDAVSIFDNATIGSGSGWFMARSVKASFVFVPVTVADVVHRIGFANSTGDTPANAVYWEADPSVSAFWQVVTRKAGTETRVTTPLSIFAALTDFDIWVAPAGQHAVFSYRIDGNTFYGIGGVITTNIPLIGLPCCVRTKTKAASVAVMDVYSISIGAPQECTPSFS